MDIDRVKQLGPVDRFLYWIKERHAIYLRRQAGANKPWTDDLILRNFFFTNPYREHDKTTVWLRENIRQPLRDLRYVLFATVAFRWFNLISTGRVLNDDNLFMDWSSRKALRILDKIKGPIFTGAFMIPAPPGSKKVEHVCKQLDYVWSIRDDLYDRIHNQPLEAAHSVIREVPWLGNFMSYEIVTDLRHTHILENAPDINTWANPGPGCIRGLRRLAGLPLSAKGNSDCLPRPDDWQEQMQKLLKLMNKKLLGMPKFEMREVEHICCEVDKYERALWQDGKMKRRYPGS